MTSRLFLAVWAIIFALSMIDYGLAAEKVRFATSMKAYPLHMLPVMTAEEKGFFKKNGLEVEWTAFDAGALMQRAAASGSLDMWVQGAVSQIQGASRGIPGVIVADTKAREDFFFFVKSDSPLKGPGDLKGAKIGVTRFGGSGHAYARAAIKALGLEKDVKFVSIGGVTQQLGSLKSGVTDGEVTTSFAFMPLMARGEVRAIIAVREFLPKDWTDIVVSARKEFAATRPEAVIRAVRALREAGDFIMKNAQWAQERMKGQWNYDDNLARIVYGELQYGPDFNISRKGLENVLNFLLEYGIVEKGRAPFLDDLYTTRFLE